MYKFRKIILVCIYKLYLNTNLVSEGTTLLYSKNDNIIDYTAKLKSHQ